MNKGEQLIQRFRDGTIRGVIFDFDGTLLNVNEALQKSIEEALEEYRIETDHEILMQEIGALLETIQGYPLPKVLLQSHDIFKYISSLESLPFLKKLRVAIKIFSKYLTYSKDALLIQGVKELIKKLSKNTDLFIVSHNQTKNIEFHLEKEGIEEFFKGVYGTDRIPAQKPDPCALQPPLEHYKSYKLSEFVMIGDMPTDIEAGQEAGFWTIGVTSGISNKEILAGSKPDLLVNSLNELIKYIF